MSRRPSSRAWLPFWALLLACFATLPALADELQADRTEFAVGETVTLKIPDAMGLLKPKWRAIPSGIVQFTDKERTEAKAKGIAPGKVQVSATVDWKLGSTTYTIALNVTAGDSSRIKPVIKDGSTEPGRRPVLDDPRMIQIGELLKRYEVELGGIRALFDKSGDGGKTPSLDPSAQAKLALVTEGFFKELGGMGLSVRDLQQFKEQYKAAGGGGSALFPGQGAWDDAFLGTERALMMGRSQLVQRLWMETLQDTFKANPDAAVFGEIDIGSWVKMRLGDLGFQADIDFSSVAIDSDLNRWIVENFQNKLGKHIKLDMVQADALLTPHGQATHDVFIGDWGKTFAELDMLKRSKWKLIKVEKNPDGSLALDENGKPKIRLVEKPGTQLFWEVAFRKLEAGKFAEVEFPKMDLAKEPMLSLEMLRHGIHDIEHGPYSRGQKLIKMLKYAERSYFMSKKAVAEFGFNPYAANDPLLAQAAEKIIANKNDPEKVADLLRTLSGEEITSDNVEAVTDKLVARAKTAMHDNAARALAFRLNAIAKIDNDAARQQAAEKLWRDLGTELDTFRKTSGDPPKIMVEAQDMAKAVMEGKLPPAELDSKANELHKLLNDAYKLPDSVIDRILMSDSVLKLKATLRKLGWIEKAIDDFANKAKQKFPNMAKFHGKVVELNEQLEKTTSGSFLLKATDWADNGFAVYEAYFNGEAHEAVWNASVAMGRIGAQMRFPSLQLPLAVYDSLSSGSPKPLGMAVAFMYFPFAGQMYMVSTQMQRADVAMRDTEFYNALDKVLAITQFDTQGKVTGFSLRNILGKEIDSETISPPGNRKAIVALFTKPDSTFYVSPNFRYWSSLVPKQDDRFGRYENKLQNLRRFFGLSEDVRYMTVMLENFKAKSDAMPQDRFAAQRQAALQRMEDQLTETLWVAMADMLESAAKSVNVAELEAKAKKCEEDLNLADDDLGKDKGLRSRIKWEIRQNSSLWTGENPYAVSLVYDKYLKACERVDALRKQVVLGVWHNGFGIDYVAAQGKPMKVLLMGGKSGAPTLSGDPDKDVELAEATLAAHQARAEGIRADLAGALGRALDAAQDKAHLKALGQIGLEWEHLLDDCAGRAAPNCEAGVRAALQDRVNRYKDYLAKLAAGNQAMTLEITGPSEMKLGESADFTAKFAKPEDKSRPGLALNWSVNGQSAGIGEKVNVKAERAGGMNLMLSATSKASGSEKKLGEAVRAVTVKDPTGGKPPAASANLAAEIDAALKARDWKRLVDRLDVEKKSDLKMKNVVAWQANIDALGVALTTLKNERMDWALAWRPYIDALDHIDSLTWDKLTRQVETKRNEVERRCWDNSSDREASDKRIARCQTEGRKFEESCVGTWPAQHWEEMKRIRIAKQELGDAVHLLHSAGYGGFRNWFEAVEALAEKHKLPFPYPKPVTPRLKYALSCANVDLTTGKKPQDNLSTIQVRVEIPSAIVPFGKPVTLNASAGGGKAPYTFAWSTGASGQRASVTPRWAGEWTVTVTATDADGKTGEGQGTLMVSPARVKMSGTQPQVFYGSQASLSLPGKEPPPPVADPCDGRKATNPFDECLRINADDLKRVPAATPGYVPPAPGMVHDVSQVQALPETGPAPRGGKQRVVWQSEPAVGFVPATSEDGRTRVTYSRMGRVKLWCEIQEMVEGAFHTVGECDQETVEVVAPKFSVSFTPAEGQGRIGQDIRLRIASEPSVPDDLIDFRWFDPATSNRLELTPNAREISFKVKDAKPVVFKALARVPHHGDGIADIAATYTGMQFQVKAWAEEPGTRPMMWDPVKGGLKPVPRGQYATHERIPLRAELQGGDAPSGVRWNWTVNDGTTISNPISQTPTVSRSSAGAIEANVEARDAQGSVLGSASVSLPVMEVRDTPPAPVNPTVNLSAERNSVERGAKVTLSADASGGKPPYSYAWQGAAGQGGKASLTATQPGNLTVSVTVTDSKGNKGTASTTLEVTDNQADRNRKEAARLGEQARARLGQNDLPGAIRLAKEAKGLDANAAGAAASEVAAAAKKAGWEGVYDRDFSNVIANLEAAYQLNPADKDAKDKLERARRFVQVWPQVETKAREFDAQVAQKKYFSAHRSLLAMQELQRDMPGTSEKALNTRIQRDFDAGMAEYNRFMRQVEETHARSARDENWALMLENAETALQREHSLANENSLKSNVEFARRMLRQQAEAKAKQAGQPLSLAGVGGRKGTPRAVKGVTVDDSSGIRLKSTDEKRLVLDIPVPTPTQAAAVAIVSNLDDATYLEQGKTIARILVSKDTGDEILDIQAGVHTSEWNYAVGPKHKRVDSADIGDNRFLVVLPLSRPGMVRGLRVEYVETNAPKWSGHAPGFVLRGVSLVADTKGLTLTPTTGTPPQASGRASVAGIWRTSEGELTLVQSGLGVKGSYTSDGGEIVGEMNGNVLEGYWIENGSAERCATAKNGRHHWGRIRWTFEGGRFSGNWSYCDKPVAGGGSWNGERIGDVPPGYAPPASASSGSAAGTEAAGSKPAGATSDEEWTVVETTPGMYRLERSATQARVARQANNPGGLQYAGLRLNRGLPASGDFSAQVSFADARIEGGLNQIELQATFADGSIFYVVRDRERSGSHIWAPNLQGDAPCGKAGVLRMERRGDTVTGYCDGRTIWSAPRKAAITRLQFVLQNNASNDPISVTFRDWRFSGSAGTASVTSSTVHAGGLAGSPRIAELTWLGMDEDRVGEWGNGKPNGTRDGHFRLTLDAPGRFALPNLSVWSANEKGEKAGGQIWHTKNGNNWMLAVFRDGRQLNASHVASLGEFSGRVTLDLYANSSGWFNPGQWFLLEIETADGKFVRQLIRLGTVGTSHGGIVAPPGGRDYTGHDSPIATPDSRPGSGYLRIEACVDGSDWISLDNGRLNHHHRAFDQIGTHGGCPVSHRVAGGGFLVDGLPVGLARLPMPVGMAGIGRFEVERGRGQVRMDGANRILIDDDGPGGSDVYIIRLYPSATTTGTPPVAIVPGGRDYTAAPVQGQLIFEVGNIGGVGNGPSKSSKFTLAAPHVVTLIRNYHWNGARGAAPGSIALKAKDGGSYGPWQATGSPGQGGVPNAYWTVYPNVTLPAGTYTVIDSDPATWSHNAESNNRGFVRVEGYPADASQPSASPSTGNSQADSLMKEVDGLLDAVKSLKGLFGK